LVLAKIRKVDVDLVENGIELPPFPQRKFGNYKTLRVGTVGRISPQKNPKDFLTLTKVLSNMGISFTWIGDGKDLKIIEEFKNSGIEVTGWVERPEVIRKLAGIDVYVQPSLWEGMPISLIEAQAMGIPGVVMNVVGNRDIISHGVNGFIANNLQEFIHYTRVLCKDNELRNKMGDAGRALAIKRFNSDRVISETLEVYSKALLAKNKAA
jgi:glycosyltransferase involved in cell wall biosynthesis